jgi:hypothetical protein
MQQLTELRIEHNDSQRQRVEKFRRVEMRYRRRFARLVGDWSRRTSVSYQDRGIESRMALTLPSRTGRALFPQL